MKKYIYKLFILFFFVYLTYEFTIGKEIRNIEEKIINKLSSYESMKYKDQLKENVKELLNKDKIFYEEDAELISKLIKKILMELKLWLANNSI